MKSIVMELQHEAYSQETSVSVLIRKAYTVARKLGITEFVEWSEKEMNGYKDRGDLPQYRVVNGYLKAFNPYNGYIPAYFPKEIDELLNNRAIFSSISEVEQYIVQGNENNGVMMYKFDSQTQMKLMSMSNVDFEVSLHIPVTQFSKIVDSVRNVLLEWTLKLEEEGILGENMTFNDEEKKAATHIPSVTNIIGTMVNSQLQQNSNNSSQSLSVGEFKVESLKEILEQGKLLINEITDGDVKTELKADLAVLETQLTSPKHKNGIIKESLMSVRNIAEGITGSLVATGIVEKIIPLLAML